MAKFGIVIAAYNAEGSLSRAINSLHAQTEADWQLAIVDDGSSDATYALAQEYAQGDTRISLLQQENKGAAAARNAGFQLLDSPWITYLDADDELEQSYIQDMLDLVSEYPGYDFYACNALKVNAVGQMQQFREQDAPREISFSEMLQKCVITGAGTLQKAKTFEQLGGFDEALFSYAEDYCYFLHAMAEGKSLFSSDKALYRYHFSCDEKSNSQHMYGKINVINCLEKIEQSKDMTREERNSLQLGIVWQKGGLFRDYWLADPEEREEILSDKQLDNNLRETLRNSRRAQCVSFPDLFRSQLMRKLGRRKGQVTWTILSWPYKGIKSFFQPARSRHLL